MELHQMRYASMVRSEGSFTAAARRARVSQSSLSTQVAKLERELGHTLFDRGRHGASVTEVGAELLPEIDAALQAVDDVRDRASAFSSVLVGTVRVGAVVGCDLPWFAAGLASFGAAHPRVRLTYREADSDRLLADVLGGRLDLCLLAHVQDLPETLTAREIVSSPLVVLLPPHARAAAMRVADLADHPVITMPPGTGVRTALDQAAARAGVAIRVGYEVSSAAMIADLVRRGLGRGVVSAAMTTEPDESAVPLLDGGHSHLTLSHRDATTLATRTLARMLWQAHSART